MSSFLRRKSVCRTAAKQLLRSEKDVLYNQKKNKLIHKEDREILEYSRYPAEYPSSYIPVPEAEVPDTKGVKVLGLLYSMFKEPYNMHRNLVWFNKVDPADHVDSPGVWIAPSATVIGSVTLCDFANVWYGAILRADKNTITVGSFTNIQDGVIITTDDKPTANGKDGAVVIGKAVTIGHGARLHACTIGNRCLIGMGATILEGAIIEDDAVVAAGAVIPAGRRVPAHEVWAGNPAKCIKHALHKDIGQTMVDSAQRYSDVALEHAKQWTTGGLAYKELQAIENKLEKNVEQTDDRPVHWNVWKKLGQEGAISLWKDRPERDTDKV